MYRALKDLGVETQLVVYPREPHGFTEYAHRLDMITRIRDWMVEHLAVPEPVAAAPSDAAANPKLPL
jgi:dipeptidyl aminopeptidase/acylaminoacyl peptidase